MAHLVVSGQILKLVRKSYQAVCDYDSAKPDLSQPCGKPVSLAKDEAKNEHCNDQWLLPRECGALGAGQTK